MKKVIPSFISLVLIFAFSVFVLVLSSCNINNTPNINQSKTCNHQWIEADCIYPKTCRICQEVEGAAKGHSFIEATCTEPKTCFECGKTDGSALGHSWNAATCKTPKTCSICATTEGNPLSEHNYQNGKCTFCNQTDPKDEEFESASIAYFYLTIAHQLCVDVMDSIYGAWYFAIYEADEYLNVNSCLNAFCSQTYLDYDDTLIALNEVLGYMGYSNPTGTEQLAALRTFSVAVDVVIQTYINYGTYDSIDINISNAKSALKDVTNSYADYTGYTTLKLYFSEISAYTEFCKSPTGSFSQLKTTIDTYETNLRNYKNDLSFIFD